MGRGERPIKLPVEGNDEWSEGRHQVCRFRDDREERVLSFVTTDFREGTIRVTVFRDGTYRSTGSVLVMADSTEKKVSAQ